MIQNIAASNDGYVYGKNATYTTARSDSFSITSSSFFAVGQLILSGNFFVTRPFIKFDTSAIPLTATIKQVNLKMTCFENHNTQDFGVQIIEQDWSAIDPITSGNKETFYDGCLAPTDYFLWRDTSGISANTEYTGADMTPAYVNKSGYTYYSLRSSRDKAGDAPSVDEFIYIYSRSDSTPAHRPVLMVEYTLPTTQFFFGLKNRR